MISTKDVPSIRSRIDQVESLIATGRAQNNYWTSEMQSEALGLVESVVHSYLTTYKMVSLEEFIEVEHLRKACQPEVIADPPKEICDLYRKVAFM